MRYRLRVARLRLEVTDVEVGVRPGRGRDGKSDKARLRNWRS
jgi:hypothetical protein